MDIARCNGLRSASYGKSELGEPAYVLLRAPAAVALVLQSMAREDAHSARRFAVEILRAVRGAIGDDPILGVTISVRTPEFERLVQLLEAECDVDYMGIGNGDYQHTELIIPPLDIEPGIGIPNAARA